MATGYLLGPILMPIIPGWDSAANPGAGEPWNNVVPLAMAAIVGGEASYPEVVLSDETDHAGAGIVDGVEIPWFETAHLLPRIVQDVGNVISEQVINCNYTTQIARKSLPFPLSQTILESGLLPLVFRLHHSILAPRGVY